VDLIATLKLKKLKDGLKPSLKKVISLK